MAAFVRSAAAWFVSALLLLNFQHSTFATRGPHRKQVPGASRVRCRDGMFDDRRQGATTGTLNCRPCSQCLPGYGVSRLCTLQNDTDCSPCPSGQYSATTSKLDGCIACRTCGKHQIVKRACTPSMDTLCSGDCPNGYFYSPLDQDCIACSPCQDHPQYEDSNVRVKACEEAGMAPDRQCWPLPTLMRNSEARHDPPVPRTLRDYDAPLYDDSTNSLLRPTMAPKGYYMRPTRSPYPGQRSSGGMDDDTARIFTIALLTLLLVAGLCVVVSIVAIVCLCRFVRETGRSFRRSTNKDGYHSIPRKTSELLVKNITYV